LARFSSFLAVLRLQLLIVGQRTPLVACHVRLSTEDYIMWQLNLSEKVSGRTRECQQDENASRTKGTILSNLIIEVTAHHFDLILFIRDKSLGPAYTQGEGLHKGVKIRKQLSLDPISETAYHRIN